MNVTTQEQAREVENCFESPHYFIQTYCKIIGGTGMIPFALFDAQLSLLDDFHNEARMIVLKARQLGVSWLAAAYGLWLCMFRRLKWVKSISIGETQAQSFLDKVKYMFDNLPDWMKPSVLERNKSVLHFGLDLGRGKIGGLNSKFECVPTTKTAARGDALDLFIGDEAAYIQWLADIWDGVLPALDHKKGKAFFISTGNGYGNMYQIEWAKARKGESSFKPVFLGWKSFPGRDQEWYDAGLRNAKDPAMYRQENPETELDAFRASGCCRFDVDMLIAMQNEAREPKFRGFIEAA